MEVSNRLFFSLVDALYFHGMVCSWYSFLEGQKNIPSRLFLSGRAGLVQISASLAGKWDSEM